MSKPRIVIDISNGEIQQVFSSHDVEVVFLDNSSEAVEAELGRGGEAQLVPDHDELLASLQQKLYADVSGENPRLIETLKRYKIDAVPCETSWWDIVSSLIAKGEFEMAAAAQRLAAPRAFDTANSPWAYRVAEVDVDPRGVSFYFGHLALENSVKHDGGHSPGASS